MLLTNRINLSDIMLLTHLTHQYNFANVPFLLLSLCMFLHFLKIFFIFFCLPLSSVLLSCFNQLSKNFTKTFYILRVVIDEYLSKNIWEWNWFAHYNSHLALSHHLCMNFLDHSKLKGLHYCIWFYFGLCSFMIFDIHYSIDLLI